MSLLKAESKPQNSQAAQSRLWSSTTTGLRAAVFFSLALHLLVLYAWLDNTKSTSISIGQQQFSALIVSPDATTIKKKTLHKNKQANRPLLKPAIQNPAIAEKKISDPATQDLQQQVQESRNAVRGQIQSRLSQYLSYPEFARRKGWQGIVVVSLQLNESGQFKEIRVNSSSGFDVLDNTALNALHKLNAIEVKQEFKLALNTMLDIPIHFKLQGS